MYKSIKISEAAYKKAKSLSRELEKSGELPGVDNVNMSVAVGYALTKTLESIKRRREFLSAAGGWKDMENVDTLASEIRKARKNSEREVVL
jgi:hypothetical protein